MLENYGTAEKMARMNSASYENLRKISRGKFSMQKFLKLKELASNTVGESNEIFVAQLNSLSQYILMVLLSYRMYRGYH